MPSGAIVTLVDYCALSPESSRTLPALIRRPNIANPILDRLDRPARGGRADGLVLFSRPLHEGASLSAERAEGIDGCNPPAEKLAMGLEEGDMEMYVPHYSEAEDS
ncbi:hypothetical protein CH63R_09078 [Colletotrichum higginsianum IMI 349063]|uniref:Uncharacterized protein n=1 Tax=Colletotrichum higginsianum (strain IMI 349063) TaxID=759273 RepID=A0A1B7Y686_COLHI|nr:hypothetical protein CH63R_09078 [Colletotrichum higginsianum IMI 349063]OBR07557.1 hypothetical protein CH63R_09078 [Colletotrichum higginsianum IMI 349063]